MAVQSLQARWVFPVAGPPIPDASVVCAEGLIREIATGKPSAPNSDLGNVALLPGLINAHTHLEFSDLETPLGQPGQALPDWIRAVIAARQLRKSDPAAAVRQGLTESLTHGTTHLADIVTVEPDEYPHAASQIGLNLLFETIAFSTGRAESALAYAEARLAASGAERLVAGLSPHAPYTVHRETVLRLAQLSAQHNVTLAMHLGESPAETELLATGGGPFRELLSERSMWDESAVAARYLDYLKMLALAPRALVVHGNELDAADFAFLAERGERMTLVHCPRTHAYFGHSSNPVAAAQRAGVRMILGTDSRASNPDLSLLAEMRAFASAHPQIDPAEVLRMATLAPAEALGTSARMGALTAGREANLVAVELPGTAGDPHELLLAGEGRVVGVWYRGQRLVPQDPSRDA